MKLLRLKLENFRQHRDSDIEFRDGMTAIVGTNGSGKTTILEAITFALYGVQRKTKESVKFYWAEPKSKLRVSLEFEFEGRNYLLDRTGTDASLIDITNDPQVIKATGLREVKFACEKLLRLSYDQFKNSFCAEQKSLAFLQFNTDTRRQEQVGKMLGFDRLKGAADLARERGKNFRFLADRLAESMGNIEQLRFDREAAKAEVKERLAAQKQFEEERVSLEKLLPAAEGRKIQADEFLRLTQQSEVFRSMAEALKSSKKRAEDHLAKAVTDANRRKELLPAHDECQQLEIAVRELTKLRELELDREKIATELTRLEAEQKEIDEKIAALMVGDTALLRKAASAAGAAQTGADNALRVGEAAWSKTRQTAQAVLSTNQAELRQAQQAYDKAKALVEKGICPECGQPTTSSFEEKLLKLGQELKLAAAALAAAEKEFKTAESRPKAVYDAEDALARARDEATKALEALSFADKAETQAKSLQDDRERKAKQAGLLKEQLAIAPPKYDRKAHTDADTRLAQLRPLRDECLKLAGAEDTLKSANIAFEEAKKEIEEARSSYKALIAERSKLPFETSEQATAAQVEFEGLRRRIAEAVSQVKNGETLVKLAEQKLKQAEEKISEYEKAEKNLKEGRRQALLHETAEKELKLLREELNSVIRPDLEARASENLSLLTNGRYPIIELDEEFNPTVIEDGIQKQVISGGEEDVVALALRMALSELIQERQGRPMSLMILDEVFGSLDVDRRQAVLERLQSIKGRFAQILVISHIEEINQVADQCIFLTRDERTRSTVIGDLPIDADELVLKA